MKRTAENVFAEIGPNEFRSKRHDTRHHRDRRIVDGIVFDDIVFRRASGIIVDPEWRCTLIHPQTNVEYVVPYNRVMRARQNKTTGKTVQTELPEIVRQRSMYNASRLNAGQLKVYDTVLANRRGITLVQAGPGTGKTFTMLTIGHHLIGNDDGANVIIYKNDLIDVYRLCACGYTVAQFFMRIFNLTFPQYRAMEKQISNPMSVERFFNVIVSLLRNARFVCKYDDFSQRLLILDEYTVIPKPLLLVLMLAVKQYRIGTVVCGDRHQLQNIHNSAHAGTWSAFDIVSSFADHVLELTCNVRCRDVLYNKAVNFIGRFSDDRPLDVQGFAMVSAIFYTNLIKVPEISDTILASRHVDLTDVVDKLVMRHRIDCSPWFIEDKVGKNVQGVLVPGTTNVYTPNPLIWYRTVMRSVNVDDDDDDDDDGDDVGRGLSDNNIEDEETTNGGAGGNRRRPSRLWTDDCDDENNKNGGVDSKSIRGKFLPYLHLVPGNTYFLNEFSERTFCTLKSIRKNDDGHVRSVIVRLAEGEEREITKEKCDEVVFEKHRNYLLHNGRDTWHENQPSNYSHLYNFPLYPASFMSIYMSQGRTITNRVSIILTHSTYQSMYVAISRVTLRENINWINFPNSIQFLVSTILNFDVVNSPNIDIADVWSRLKSGSYAYYDVPVHRDVWLTAAVAAITLPENGKPDRRRHGRDTLIRLANRRDVERKYLSVADQDVGTFRKTGTAHFGNTIQIIIDLRYTIMALAHLTHANSVIWTRIFLTNDFVRSRIVVDGLNIFTCARDNDYDQLMRTCLLTETTTYMENETHEDFLNKLIKNSVEIDRRKSSARDLIEKPYEPSDRLKNFVLSIVDKSRTTTTTTTTTNENDIHQLSNLYTLLRQLMFDQRRDVGQNVSSTRHWFENNKTSSQKSSSSKRPCIQQNNIFKDEQTKRQTTINSVSQFSEITSTSIDRVPCTSKIEKSIK